MIGRVLTACALAAALSACLEADVVRCGELICPAGFTCGNGELDADEACDDGNFDERDGCSADCRSDETCGNQVIDEPVGEACDDGNTTPGDGCSDVCQPEFCGNGIVDTVDGEVCDDGNFVGGDGCAANCRSDELCGNGALDWQLGEVCDCGDGTASVPGCGEPNSDEDGATCWTDCTLHGCGDGVVELVRGEVCDGEPAAGYCVDFGFDAGPLGCSTSCTAGFDDCDRLGWYAVGVAAGTTAVWAFAVDDVFAVANTSTAVILHWDGVAWTEMVHPPVAALTGLWGSSSSDVWAVGDGGTILHYDGTAWIETPSGITHSLADVGGSGPGHAIAVSGFGELIEWDGAAWTQVDDLGPLGSVWVTSPTEAWAGSFDGPLFHGVDGVWTEVPIPATGVIDLWAAAPDDLYVLAFEGVLHYDGATFTAIPLRYGLDAYAIGGSGPDDVYVTAHPGTIYHYDGQVWLATASGLTATSVSAIPGAAFAAAGSVLRTDGQLWAETLADPPGRLALEGIGGVSASELHAVGAAGLAMHFDGAMWKTVSAGTLHALHAVWERTAVGDHGAIVRWNGTAWIPMVSGTEVVLRSAWGSGPSDLWAVGANTILHHDGTAWSSTTVAADLIDVWGVAANDVYAVGAAGRVLHWNGGTWSTISAATTGTNVTLQAVWGSAANDIWIAGAGGTVRHWTGTLWENRALPVASTIVAMRGVSASEVYAAVQGTGDVYRWSGSSWLLEAAALRAPGVNGRLWTLGSTVYAAGNEALATRAGAWRSFLAAPDFNFRGISGTGPDDIWHVNPYAVTHFDGVAWTDVPAGLVSNTSCVWAAARDDVFVGGFGGVKHWRDGAWVEENTTYTLALHGSSPTDVWLTGLSGMARHYDGNAWTTVATGSTKHLVDVWVASPTAAFAVENDGDFLHWDGTQWTAFPQPPGPSAFALHGYAADDVFAIGASGTAMHWDGVAWSRLATGTTALFRKLDGTGPDDELVIGASGFLLHFDGSRWAPVRSLTIEDLLGIEIVGDHTFLVSASGSIRVLYRGKPW